MVPIVYGMKLENYIELAPPNSFIHIDQFASIADLTKYLIYLDKNDTAYANYFAWKAYGYITVSQSHLFCIIQTINKA